MLLTVYSRPDCGLCEELVDELATLTAGLDVTVEIVDVDGDAELARRYGLRIPVVCIDGEFVCAHRLDAERVQRWLALQR